MRDEILYIGKKTKKQMMDLGILEFRYVIPCVAFSDNELGVMVFIFREKDDRVPEDNRFWGMKKNQDLIVSWRATKIIEELPTMSNYDLSASYAAAIRNTPVFDRKLAERIVATIGAGTYEEIMNIPIPPEILSLIYRLDKEGRGLNFQTLTEEVEAGNLEWTNDLAGIGVIHPDKLREKEKAYGVVLARYKVFLTDYYAKNKLRPESFATQIIENSIIQAVEKGLEKKYGPDIVVGIAVIRSHLAAASYIMDSEWFGKKDQDIWNKEIEASITEAIEWLQVTFKKPLWKVLRQPVRSQIEYTSILTELQKRFDDLPVTNPLNA